MWRWGFHKPGKEFAPHKHPVSEEIAIIHSGKGECYLYDKWIPVETGDIVFAPPGVLHGTAIQRKIQRTL
ncbi:MAG: cupin domain-containing protein [Enterocloster sp.]